ncbi:hypothetical protein NP493_538g06038 [Ridgeia piscesae]|uniref:Protein PET100, mitochondrial n=1 Tax=Ridgeia piscesae TaxID=27915 RepID=A0AAD9NQF8_RIDPI|nr:hypothetical protein NP493_538g06038 [Ridgeia piscesae]
MGTWRLEALRVAIYMTFPVGTFWWFNQPENFEDWLIEQRKLMFPDSRKGREAINRTRALLEKRRAERMDAELKRIEAERVGQ